MRSVEKMMFLRSCRFLPHTVLFVVAAALYSKSIGFEFLPTWDDSLYVINNNVIKNINFSNLKVVFTSAFVGHYAPLHICSYLIDYAFFGLDPAGYHFFNLILHAANACLAFACVQRITLNKGISFIAILFFAVHPINVENVAWISERKTLLSALFFFLSCIYYLKFREKDRGLFYFWSIIFFACAVLSKVTTVILPLVFFAFEFLLTQTRQRRILLTVPFFVIALGGVIVWLWANSGEKVVDANLLTLNNLFGTEYPTMMPVFWQYIKLIVLPVNLSGYYDTTIYHSFMTGPVLISAIALAGLFCIALIKGTPQVRFWFLWFWICLLPTSNLIPTGIYCSDHLMYLPVIGFFVLWGIGFEKLSVYLKESKSQIFTRLIYGGVLAAVIFYSAVSFERLEVWRNEQLFWEDTVKKSPNLYTPRLNLGVVYDKKGMLYEAAEQYRAAIAIEQTSDAIANLRIVMARIQLRNK